MANNVVQTIKDAEIDARTLSEFISKDAHFTVTRRLAPTIHTLDYYLLVLNKVKEKGDLADIAISDTLDKLEQLEPTVIQRVDDAINNTAVDGGVLADTFLTVENTINQRQVNRGFESVDELLNIANPKDGLRVYVKSYHAGLNKGGGYFTYDSSKASINNGGVIINGWVREYQGAVRVDYFGAVGDGVTDDANAIQKTIDYAYTLMSSRTLSGSNLFNIAYAKVLFQGGFYKVSKTLQLDSDRVLAIEGEYKAVIFGDGDKSFDLFVGNNLWRLNVKGLTFVNFDTVFNISSANLDYAAWHFNECQVQNVNIFLDSGTYNTSRSTNVVFDRCMSQWNVGQFARVFCDTVTINECWLGLSTEGTALIYGNSLFSLNNCALLPAGQALGYGTAWVHLTDDNGEGGTHVDKNRGVSVNNCRISNEGGNGPIVVADYAVLNPRVAQGGPVITISNMAIVGFHPSHYEDGGTETGVVQILKYPEAVSFVGCTFYTLGNERSYLVAKNSTVTEVPHDRFNIWLDGSSKKSAAYSANSYANTSKIADSLRGYVNNPEPAIFKDILEFGYLPVTDSNEAGRKKATFKITTGWGTATPGTIPATFMLVLTGHDRESGSSPVYAGSSVYIVSLSGIVSAGANHKITSTKLHGAVFGVSGDANADIVSVHFGSDDTGDTSAPAIAEQVITVTFGSNIRYGKAKIVNYLDYDGIYPLKPTL